jgi:hypothetical protein
MPGGTRTMVVKTPGGEQEWVHADDFMAVQKERDDLRRTVAFINAHRWSGGWPDMSLIDRLLGQHNFGRAEGRAMLSVVRGALDMIERRTGA